MLRAMAKTNSAKATNGWLFAFLLASCTVRVGAVECATAKVRDREYTTCRVASRTESLRLYHADEKGRCHGSFERLRESLGVGDRTLLFAMNAGMFHADCRPVGLLVVDGRELAPVNRSSGTGNFFLEPNGVFLIDDAGPRVVATHEFRDQTPIIATQSGPMLVHRGLIPSSPAFAAGSRSRRIRNGVCVPRADEIALVISEGEVTFNEFANYFRQELGCSEALYLDGSISSLYAPALGRADARAPLGPMLAIVK
jgi:uncharacterized protein YigE (DUF2233 family)